MTTFLDTVIQAFKGDANRLIFTEHDHEIIVQGRQFIPNEQWNAMNAMVEQEFHGRYSSLIRGWAIPKPVEEPAAEAVTRTGIPRLDEKLETVDAAREDALRRQARAVAHRPTPQDMEWARETLGLEIDPSTGRPVELDLLTADEILAEQQEDLEAESDEEDDEEEPGLTATGDYVGEVPLGEGFQVVPLDQLTTAAVKLRQTIDEAQLKGMADTMEGKGILQPILVRPHGDHFEIVAGEQRYRAAQIAGLSAIPCVIKTLTDREAFEAALIENDQRKDITDYERARAYRHLLTAWPDEYPSQKVLANKMGKSETWVSSHLAILDLESKIAAPQLSQITHTQAREMRATDIDTQDAILQTIRETGEVPSTRKIAETKAPTGAVSKAKPYWCSWCQTAKAPYQVMKSWDGSQLICKVCGRAVEHPPMSRRDALRSPEHRTESSSSALHGPAAKEEHPSSGQDRSASLVRPPTTPFPERLKVTVSQAERDVYQDLLTAYEQGRLKARPILNDDRVVFYVVRASYPDIIFAGVEAPVYLDNEAIHHGREAWDDAVVDALRRQKADPQRYVYVGSLTATRRNEIVGAIITRINKRLTEEAGAT